jgi:NAD(P)-dependent dehydrogenase (short-subunit alcohol dehydrogenase family)
MSSASAMSDRVVIVTGASQGIGAAIATGFASIGDHVVLAARNQEALSETAELVTAAGGMPMPVVTDVTDPDSVDDMVAAVMAAHGRIDVLVNNSGVAGPSGRLWEIEPDEWKSTFEVNVFGVYLATRAVLPVMVDQKSGSVVIVGSITGKRPLFGRSSYAATKTAVVGLTRTLATEAGPEGVRVNLVSPGFVAGPRLDWVIEAQAKARDITPGEVRREFEAESPMGRLTEPEDVARAVVFLASEDAAGMTGVDLNVNSGAVMY